MKNSLLLWFQLSLTCFCLFQLNISAAQTKSDEIVNQWAIKPLKIDGKLDDWGDTLKNYNEDTRFSFGISNDQETLYLAIKSKDRQNLNRILSRGITFSVNTEARKKPGATIIFPVPNTGGQPKAMKALSKEEVKKNQQKMLSELTQINVSGFADIKDGAVSIHNNYGISAAANLDAQETLIIEIAIPFQLLNINTQSQIACLMEINGIKQPRSTYNPNRDTRGGMYGYPSRDYDYDRRPAVNKQNLTTGFWIKTTLAKKP